MRHVVLASLVASACSPTSAPTPRHPEPGTISLPPQARRSVAARELALFRRFPALRGRLPWVRLANLPTPVEAEPRLAARLGVGELWVKRDDLSADVYGGNKVRKLELYLGAALAEGKRSVLTFGGVGSNHALATAVHARRVGLRSILLLLPQTRTAHVRHNLLAAAAQGAELHLVNALDERAAARPYVERRAPEDRPYVIPTGGTAPLGDVGFVNAGLELAEQVAAGALPAPHEVWVAFGTGGSAAGIALGLAVAGLPTRVMCVRVSSPRYGTWRHLAQSFDRTRDYLRQLDPSFPEVRLTADRAELVHDFAGQGYGIASRAGTRARELARDEAQLELDDTYTGKTLAALAAVASERRHKVIVFWNTYDARSISAGEDALEKLPRELRAYAR